MEEESGLTVWEARVGEVVQKVQRGVHVRAVGVDVTSSSNGKLGWSPLGELCLTSEASDRLRRISGRAHSLLAMPSLCSFLFSSCVSYLSSSPIEDRSGK